MNVKVSDHAGFCFGVKRAVDQVEQLLAQGQKVCTLGPLIHNPQVVDGFAKQGVLVAETPEQVPPGYTVVIRSHGVRREIFAQIKAQGNLILDATCPYVSKIHRIAEEAAAAGKIVLVAGDEQHPEVQGILSYCAAGSRCFGQASQFLDYLARGELLPEKNYILLAQTTFRQGEWDKYKESLKQAYTNVVIFDTICNATVLRQKAAAELAAHSDLMIVVGGRNSSNTEKLGAICQEHCITARIELPQELEALDLSGAQNIGVTAGASTPAFIIKEVQRIMSDIMNDNEEMSFEEMLNESFKTVSAREKVTAIVTSVAPNEIAVDIGTKHAGYVPLYEYTDDPSANLMELVKPGDEIELLVLRLNDAEGTALLSKKRLDAIAGFEKIVEAEEADEKLTGQVVDIVKGGIIALTNGVRVFIPASQASLHRGQDLETLRGTEVEYKILETNKGRRRAVGSIRAILREERKELADEFWGTVEVGQVHKGIVKSLTSYGAFIDLGGVDGMAHISELSWSRIKHPSDVLTVGQEVEVRIKDIDQEGRKISLGYKSEENNPWKILEKEYKAGDVVTAKVVSMTAFGAFAQVIPGVDGLIHISQISHDRIAKPSDVLTIGQEIDVAITDIDFDRKRVSLSIRALLDDDARREEEQQIADGGAPEVVAQAAPPAEESAVEEAVAEDVIVEEVLVVDAPEKGDDAAEAVEAMDLAIEQAEDEAEELKEEVIEEEKEETEEQKED